MSDLKIDVVVVGQVRTNCFIISNEMTREAVIVDPGEDAQLIINKVQSAHLMVKAVMLTHGHFDHFMAAKQVVAEYGVPVYSSEQEKDLLEKMELNCSEMFGVPSQLIPDIVVKDGQKLELLGTEIEVISTPGHTKGSVCYFFSKEKLLISGDTLFFESVGRTDLPTGNSMQIVASIRERLFVLPDEVTVYPGHGCTTTIGYEKMNNPYV